MVELSIACSPSVCMVVGRWKVDGYQCWSGVEFQG